jgi:hypothetical protein
VPRHPRLFLTTGVLGGFTTFQPSHSMPRCSWSGIPMQRR